MQTGLKYKAKPKEKQVRHPDLSTTSRSKAELRFVRKNGTPEQVAELEAKVSEAHPDMLITRRER